MAAGVVMKPPMRIADKPRTQDEAATRQPRTRAFEKFQALKGTIHLQVDVNELRGRNR